MTKTGQWHGKRFYFGLHYDLHANAGDDALGTRCGPGELVPALKRIAPDFVQTDCKGHAGYTSWFSMTPGASLPPRLKLDALAQWRVATRKLGLPLHCHYSGIWDRAAGTKHPEWCVVGADGKGVGAPFGPTAAEATNEIMCPRSPYLDELMIPQLLELIDRYEVDGFWIDGDIWAVKPCYCKRCRATFAAETGILCPPENDEDPNWPAWRQFALESYEAYVTRYCEAVHNHKPGVLVCSNWLQTFKNPGPPTVPTDWISGDNVWVYGLDGSRCEARFLSTRGKPWDIMLWGFYTSHGMGKPDSPWTAKPTQMLMQEAAVLLSFGGQVQIYQNGPPRDGRLLGWKADRFGEVGRFIKKRRRLCQDAETIPQVAVLHSEAHARRTAKGTNLLWGVDVAPVQGAAFSLLEHHYGVDILDEWALLPRLQDFPVVVAPEQDAMSDDMVGALKAYVREGGRLLVSGAAAFERFGAAFLGVTRGKLVEGATFLVPAADGDVPLFSASWRLVKPKGARPFGALGQGSREADGLRPHPAATLHKVGKGQVLYVPANVFRAFDHCRYPLLRAFIGEMTQKVAGKLGIRVSAPTCVDVALRRKGDRTLVHFVNRASGIPNQPGNGAVDEIPPVGPLVVKITRARKPESVRLELEKGQVDWQHTGRTLTVTVPAVHIHAVLVVK